jgi:hypothetical protein
LLTSGIFGRPGITLSASDNLQSSLASNLRRLSDEGGWSLCRLTWKYQAMPSGRSQPVLRGSARRPDEATIYVTGNTGVLDVWGTPLSRDWKDGREVPGVDVKGQLGRQVWAAAWKTPTCPRDNDNDGLVGKVYASKKQCDLAEQAWLTHHERPEGQTPGCFAEVELRGWPSPTASDGSGGRTTQTKGGGSKYLDREVKLAQWTTPTASEANAPGDRARGIDLRTQAQLTGWPTPTSKEKAGGEYSDPRKAYERAMGPHANDLRDFAQLANPALTSSTAQTANGGRLRSGHSRWLMRIPIAWENCAPTETPSTLRKRKPSWPPSSAAAHDLGDLA